ncbi:MAG: SPFH domain-containing protein [Planctomycetota bacterium]
MADQTPHQPISPESSRERPRSASVQLRGQDDGAPHAATMMDPANQSLADALRITFRLLQAGMFVLVGLFVLSGFQTIREGQAGIRLLFGKAETGELDPGFRFSFPYPVGELVKVQTGTVQLVENSAFWPEGNDGQPASSVDDLPMRRELRPATDGSVLTADGSIAHTQWSIQYRRGDPRLFAESVLPRDEESIVLAAVQRGVVQAVGTTMIDDLLKQGGESLASQVRTIAQQTLDTARSGITIESLSLDSKTPPKVLKADFDSVQAAASEAATAELEAETERGDILNRVAGRGAQPLIGAIREYEIALATGDEAGARATLTRIDSMLEGRPVEIDGETMDAQVAGEVASIIASARRERSEKVSRTQAKLSSFRAYRARFEVSPAQTIKQVAFDSLASFLGKPYVQTFTVPAGTDTLQLMLNSDPDIRKALITEKQLREAEEAERQREILRREGEHTIQRGLPDARG